MHQRRAEKLYGLIAEQPRTGHELAQALWGDVAVTQAFLTLSEVIGHVDLLVNAGHVREIDDGEVVRYEATSQKSRRRTRRPDPGREPGGPRRPSQHLARAAVAKGREALRRTVDRLHGDRPAGQCKNVAEDQRAADEADGGRIRPVPPAPHESSL